MKKTCPNYRFIIFSLGWLALVLALWVSYKEWIIRDWGAPLWPWLVVVYLVYRVDKPIWKKISKEALLWERRKYKRIEDWIIKFMHKSFEESWSCLRVELLVILVAAVFFSVYYFISLAI